MVIGKKLGEILVESNLLSELQLKEVLRAQKLFFPEKKLGEVVLEREYTSENDVFKALADQGGFDFIDLGPVTPSENARTVLPDDKSQEFEVIPVSYTDGVLTIATSEASNLNLTDGIDFYLNGLTTKYVVATPSAIELSIRVHIEGNVDGDMSSQISQTILDMESELEVRVDEIDPLDSDENSAPIITLVDSWIKQATEIGASDIHIEPFEEVLRVRFRIDGVLREQEAPRKQLQSSIIARIKIMSGMNISEKRKPQDGRIKLRINDEKVIDLRVSALPAYRGESVVMRILDPENTDIGLDQLGLSDNILKSFNSLITRPNGIFMLCGPTGSGKTTTLYAALQHLNKPNVKIITAEEPVEYSIYGINQCDVKRNIGLTFERIVRAMLRQAPNVILIGEIRDLETANIAVRASLTGHLVFSTIHTNDAPSAITRLIDIGLEGFLVASSISAVLAQRLVRTICSRCAEPISPNLEGLEGLNIPKAVLESANWQMGKGCQLCYKTGMKGRMGIHELMIMNTALRKLTYETSTTLALRQQAIQNGMISLFNDGLQKAMNGKTTIEEILTYARVAE